MAQRWREKETFYHGLVPLERRLRHERRHTFPNFEVLLDHLEILYNADTRVNADGVVPVLIL